MVGKKEKETISVKLHNKCDRGIYVVKHDKISGITKDNKEEKKNFYTISLCF